MLPNNATPIPVQDEQEQETDYTTELATLSQRIGDLVDPGQAAYDIGNVLETLYAKGTDAEALETIQAGAEKLLETSDQLLQAFKTTVEIARALQQQRNQASQKLAQLRQAIAEEDWNQPEIEQLIESIREQIEECNQQYFYDVWFDMASDQIVSSTGLDWNDASRLLGLITGDTDLPIDHGLWIELREWLDRAEEASEQETRVLDQHLLD
jgi:hypothetical protein